MVAHTAHITQQIFLIGSFLKNQVFYWSKQCHQYHHPYMISPYKITPHIHFTHIYMSCISHLCGRIIKHIILEILYDGTEHRNKRISHLLGIISQLNKFHTISSQICTTYNSQSIVLGIHSSFSTRNQ